MNNLTKPQRQPNVVYTPILPFAVTCNSTLRCLHDLGWAHLQLGTEDAVPETASDAKAILIVGKMVLEMVLLELLVPGRKLLMVQEVVGHVVEGVPEDTTSVSSCRSIPIVEKNGVRKLPEWCCKRGEQRGRHDQSILVHGKIVVDAVEKKV